MYQAQHAPLERFPKLAPLLTPEVVTAWEENGHCLCGCGRETALMHGRGPEHNYFVRGHAHNVKRQLLN